eukprot:TRINITY_DN13585_c1_g4_i1.p1 TRINITY_DN13585_c1_g4~~TRINITY_DN13585_c1_g4_i1.p1  ORF type:complete len:643 (-),score=136.71 TRINITY_DN13585_c1_g4_i1:109-2037(-)
MAIFLKPRPSQPTDEGLEAWCFSPQAGLRLSSRKSPPAFSGAASPGQPPPLVTPKRRLEQLTFSGSCWAAAQEDVGRQGEGVCEVAKPRLSESAHFQVLGAAAAAEAACAASSCEGSPSSASTSTSARPSTSTRASSSSVHSSSWRRRLSLVVDNAADITKCYDLAGVRLGRGRYGQVRKCRNLQTGQIRAVKTMSKAEASSSRLRMLQEIEVMKALEHPNITRLFETFEDEQNLHLVMELCSGGELFDRILQTGHFTEKETKLVMRQLLGALAYMHDGSILHRDVKPENILLTEGLDWHAAIIKLADFGVARRLQPGCVATTRVGTPHYIAPQVIARCYNQACDVWSAGVLMYVLLCGYPPFRGKTDMEVLGRIKKGTISYKAEDWDSLSKEAQELSRSMLRYDMSQRITAAQAACHRWMELDVPLKPLPHLRLERMVQNIRGFRTYSRLKKVVLQVIATQLEETSIVDDVRRAFLRLDANRDGHLTLAELRIGLESVGLQKLDRVPASASATPSSRPPSEPSSTEAGPSLADSAARSLMEELLEDMDCDGSGTIDYREFIAATLDQTRYEKEDVCWDAFCVFDRDRNGSISISELQKILSAEASPSEQAAVEGMLAELDQNGDGAIDFAEFKAALQKPSS